MSYFTVDILTPSKVVTRDLKVGSAFIPTVNGEINLLPEHTHLIATLDTGIIKLVFEDKNHYYSSTTGTLKVIGNKITILLNVCENPAEINRERAERSLNNSLEKLKNSKLEEDEILKYQRKVARASVRMQLIKLLRK